MGNISRRRIKLSLSVASVRYRRCDRCDPASSVVDHRLWLYST